MNTKRACFLFLLALTLTYGGYNLGRSLFGPVQGLDFAQYYVASRLVMDGDLSAVYSYDGTYQDRAREYGVRGVLNDGAIQPVMTNAYPPFVALFMIPFALLPYDIARYVFFTLSVSVTFCTIPLLFANRDKDYRKELILIGWFAAFLFFPNYFSLYNGQINSLLFFFCALALFFIRKKRLWLAGLFVALASLIKIFPLVLLPFFVFKRQYKLIGITLVLIILLVSLSVLVSDFELYTIFFTEALPRQFSAGPHYRNQGFVGFFTRLLTQNQYTQSIGDYPNTAYLLASISSVIILGSTVLCTRWKPDSGTFRYEIEYGFYFVAALLILAKSHEHFAMFLLFSFLFLFEFLAYGRPSGQALLFFVSVSFCVWAFVLTGGVEYDQLPKNILMNLVVSSKFIATLLLFVCNVWILRRKGEANLLAPVGAPPASSQSLTGV